MGKNISPGKNRNAILKFKISEFSISYSYAFIFCILPFNRSAIALLKVFTTALLMPLNDSHIPMLTVFTVSLCSGLTSLP
jgi:hypothetical protein